MTATVFPSKHRAAHRGMRRILWLGTARVALVAVAAMADAQTVVQAQPTSRDSVRSSPVSKVLSPPSPAIASSQTASAGGGDSASGPLDAIARARSEFERTGVAREIRAGARLVMPFGRSQPTLTCSPLHLCLIELEPGETILTKGAGDPTRWLIQEGSSGANGTTPLLAIKPTRCDIATNFVASTTRRIYEITLDSPPCPTGRPGGPQDPYARHISFWYPDGELADFANERRPGGRARVSYASDS
ncbi:MAG: TrbG/VirB9 family P-type conjugative transfer protein, partial [Gemmatimonadota bacterium]|nr:TrbG/VirB9 family P-type conjugative transfer protein [Gemmatimonadota bacterium]